MPKHLVVCLLFVLPLFCLANPLPKTEGAPRIVNIVNFIRQLEPRDAAVSEDVLYETVQNQIKLMAKYNLPGTFLLQYDALINPRYQTLLKTQLGADSEVGGWWEITQPHVEAAGLKWRGRYPWDWHANVGFSTGYTPEEREKLVDVFMAKFKAVFGKYPTAIGSWFIDSYSLAYMYDKYHIVASSNCKDQIGTDGYTLWGGYWNQAYYPSRLNAYMPAQTAAGQIGVPIFRMLGSDPIYQYSSGLGGGMQGVESLEPVYENSGASKAWVNWLLKSMATEPCLSFAYTQAGQENSFTWAAMHAGLEMQFPIFDSLRNAGKIKIETLSASGRWFKSKYPLTPAAAVTALEDYKNQGHKTVWYNSRFYRTNLLWSNDSFCFRDIHLFDEKVESPYFRKPLTGTQCIYKTLPLVDGFEWSTISDHAGLRLVSLDANGKATEITGNDPEVTELEGNILQVKWSSKNNGSFTIKFYDDRFEVQSSANEKLSNWALELHTASGVTLPFTQINTKQIQASFNGFKYSVICKQGVVEKAADNADYVFRIKPLDNKIVVDCSCR